MSAEMVNKTKMPMRGVVYALLASFFFGAATPFAKILIDQTGPVLLAGLFYGGSGLGLCVYRIVSRQIMPEVNTSTLSRKDWPFLLGAIAAGGVFAPIMLMLGIQSTTASTASLLLNAEGVLTALIAWFVFKENFDARIAWGMIAIAAGGLVLSLQVGTNITITPGLIFVLAACLGWAIDNNLTRKVASADATQIACYKGLVAGAVNTTLAFLLHERIPPIQIAGFAMMVGFFGYGVSLVMYVLGLRHIGTARTGAYFAIAPFIGVIASIVFLKDPITVQLMTAGVLMAVGLWLHLTEQHAHWHNHKALEHEHMHMHDEHHQHQHLYEVAPGTTHVHRHRHEALSHDHPHFPDEDHFHEH